MVVLHRLNPERRMSRFYALSIERDLFGRVVLVRQWGRIGARGVERRDEHPDEAAAGVALERLAAVKRRRGYREV